MPPWMKFAVFATPLLVGLVGVGFACWSASSKEPAKEKEKRCASPIYVSTAIRCCGVADPRCAGGNCSGHCRENCNGRCIDLWQAERDFMERHPEVH